ncbi:uracil-DNA glycosylase family protein [Maritalea sp. S77]|uniref:uracil-DNA glycosylase family protein n=1 Tax=Maritalea sp. S77 TaxID=3415125 RepID=UPI003C7BAF08
MVECLKKEIAACTLCLPHLAHGVRPVVQLSKRAKIAIAGQAPGRVVHETGVPFNDQSGDRLREWLGVDRDQFYNPDLFAIVPMGYCFPGTGKSGDLPPRPECRATWHDRIFQEMDQLELIIVIGAYAIDYHLGGRAYKTLTDTVKNWREFEPRHMVLPHPSPRNNIWLRRNPWFETDVLPSLRNRVHCLSS